MPGPQPTYGPKRVKWDPTMSGSELKLRPATATWPKPVWPDPRRCPGSAEVNFYLRELRHPPAWAVKENADRALAASAAKVTRLDARPPPKGCSLPKGFHRRRRAEAQRARRRHRGAPATAATADANASLRSLVPGLNNLPVSVTPTMQRVLEGVAARVHAKRLVDIDRRGKVAAANIRADERASHAAAGGGGDGRRGSTATSALTTPYVREWMQWRRRDDDIDHIPAFTEAARNRAKEVATERARAQRIREHKRAQVISRAAASQLAHDTAKANRFLAYG